MSTSQIHGVLPIPGKAIGIGGLERVVFVVFLALSVNAVLIQTVVSEESQMKNFVRVGAIILLLAAMVLNNTRIAIWIILALSMCFALLLMRGNTDQLSYIFVLLLVPAMLPLDERRTIRMLVIGSLVSLVLVFLLLWTGVTQNEILKLRDRQTFGTNGVPFFYNLVYGAAVLAILYTQKYWRRGRFLVLIASLVTATALFTATDARGGYYSLLAFVSLLVVVPIVARVYALRVTVALLPMLFFPFAFFLASRPADADLNQLWSNRPYLYDAFLSALHPDDYLLSTSVKYFDRVQTIVDNSYLHLLIGGGIIVCCIVIVIFFRSVMNLFREGRHVELSFLIATCFYFNSESIIVRIENLFVIYFWYLIIKFSGPAGLSSNLSNAAA
ncbi:MAG: hypothetical protein M3Z35_16760 [Nitrospirota bacterium]|nr:hypothetical protein [Nitrospirota bacterium]